MTHTFQTVLDRIQTVSQLINGIPAGDKEPVLQSFQKELREMSAGIQNIQQQDANGGNTDEIREMLAGCRAELFRVIKEIDILLTDFAEAYRQSIGGRKDQFEQLSDILQQNSDPQAYQHKYVFGQLSECKDQIRMLSGSIMDLEGRLEHEQLAQKGLTVGDQPDVSRLGAPSDRPSLSP